MTLGSRSGGRIWMWHRHPGCSRLRDRSTLAHSQSLSTICLPPTHIHTSTELHMHALAGTCAHTHAHQVCSHAHRLTKAHIGSWRHTHPHICTQLPPPRPGVPVSEPSHNRSSVHTSEPNPGLMGIGAHSRHTRGCPPSAGDCAGAGMSGGH